MQLRKEGKKWIRLRICLCLLFAGVLCCSAFAGDPSTNVWISVFEESRDTRISVTVPVSYGFVVVGSMDAAAASPISVSDGNLLLPNTKVTVSQPSNIWDLNGSIPGNSVYQLETVGSDAFMTIRNYSTDIRDENLSLEEPPREGLPVRILPFLVEREGASSNHWKASADTPNQTLADFKKYRMILGGEPLCVSVAKQVGGQTKNVLERISYIDVAAPPDVGTNGHTAAGTAVIPSETYVAADIEVGGAQNQYKQVEESAKIAAIHWEVRPGALPAAEP